VKSAGCRGRRHRGAIECAALYHHAVIRKTGLIAALGDEGVDETTQVEEDAPGDDDIVESEEHDYPEAADNAASARRSDPPGAAREGKRPRRGE
jgi:hypothetical protein